MATLASLAINLIAQTNRFTRPLAESSRHVDRFASRTEASLRRVEQAGKRAGVAFAAIQASIIAATKLAADYAGNIDTISQATGIAIESVQKLSYAVSQSSSDVDTLASSLRALARRSAEAFGGHSGFARNFERIGVSVADANGQLKDLEPLLMEVADAVASMNTESEMAAALMNVMGDAGRRMVPFMKQGSAGIRALMEEAERLGLVMETRAVRQLAAFGDQTSRTKNRIGALSREMAAEFIPALDLIDRFVNRVIDGFMGLDDEARANAAMLATMTAAVLGLVMGLGMIAVGVGLAAKTLTFFGTIVAFAFSPLFLQLAAVGIFVTLAITQFDRLVEWWKGTEWGQIVAEAWEQIRETWQRDDLTLGQKVLSTVSIVVESVVGLVESITRWWVNTSVTLAEKTVALVGLDPDENALVGFLRTLQDIWNDSELTFGEKVIASVSLTALSVVDLLESIGTWWVRQTIELARKTAVLVGLDPEESALVGFLDGLLDIWNRSDLSFGQKTIESLNLFLADTGLDAFFARVRELWGEGWEKLRSWVSDREAPAFPEIDPPTLNSQVFQSQWVEFATWVVGLPSPVLPVMSVSDLDTSHVRKSWEEFDEWARGLEAPTIPTPSVPPLELTWADDVESAYAAIAVLEPPVIPAPVIPEVEIPSWMKSVQEFLIETPAGKAVIQIQDIVAQYLDGSITLEDAIEAALTNDIGISLAALGALMLPIPWPIKLAIGAFALMPDSVKEFFGDLFTQLGNAFREYIETGIVPDLDFSDAPFAEEIRASMRGFGESLGRGLGQVVGWALEHGPAAIAGMAAEIAEAAWQIGKTTLDYFLEPFMDGFWTGLRDGLGDRMPAAIRDAVDNAMDTFSPSTFTLTVGLAVFWTFRTIASLVTALMSALLGRGVVQAGAAATSGAASKIGAGLGMRLRQLIPLAVGLMVIWDILRGDNLLGNLLRDVKSFLGVEPGSTGDWVIDIGTTVALGVAIDWSIKAASSLASGLIGAIAAASGGVLVAAGLGLAFAIPIYMALEPTLSMEPMEDTIWHLTAEERKALFASGPEYAPPAPGSGATIDSTEDLAEFFGVDPSVLEQFDTDHLFAPGGIFSGDLIYPEFFAVQEAAEESADAISVMLDVLEDYSDLAQRLEREGIDLERFMLVLGEMESGWQDIENSVSSARGEFQLLAGTRAALEAELGAIDWDDPAERMRASFEWLRMGVEGEFATIAAAAERLGIQLEEALHLWWVVGGPALKSMQSLDTVATMGVTAGELLARRRDIPSFAEGGWTGDMPADQFAGFVHGREIVIPERAHRKGLAGILEFLGVPGYEDGLSQRIPGLDAGTAAGITTVEGFLGSVAGQVSALIEMMDSGIESLLTLLETTLLESARGILPEDQFAALEERTLSLTRTVRDGWQQFKDLFHSTSDLDEAFGDLTTEMDNAQRVAEQQAAIATLQGRILARLTILNAALEGARAGEPFAGINIADIPKKIVQGLRQFADWISNIKLSDPSQLLYLSGATIGALIAVAMESETLAQIFRILNDILAAGANALGMLLEPLLPLIYVLQAVLVPVFSVLGQVLEHMLLPIMPFIFEAFKWLGVAVLFVAEVFQTARAFILNAVGGLVEGIGRFIDSLPFFSAKGMIQAGINMQKSAEQAAKSAEELGAARRDLIDLTYEEAMARAKHTEELERATQALINVPIGMRTLNRLRWESATPRADVGIAAPPGLQVSASTAPAGGGGDMVFTGPITVVSNDPEDFERQLRQYRRRENLIETGTTAAMRRV